MDTFRALASKLTSLRVQSRRCMMVPSALLIVWAGLSILGFVIKGLFWLAVIGIALFAVTLIVGLVRQRGDRS